MRIGIALALGIALLAGESTAVTAKMNAGSSTIVVIGASTVASWDSGGSISGYKMINKGVSGQQSFEMLARFEADVIALQPDAVIIWGFLNDIYRSDQTRIDQTLVRARESLLAMVKMARKAGIRPILATEVPIRGKDEWSEMIFSLLGAIRGKRSYEDYINGYVFETNRWIRDTATREGILLLDLETVLADSHNVRCKDYSRPDGRHISQRGYEVLTRYTEERIGVLLAAR